MASDKKGYAGLGIDLDRDIKSIVFNVNKISEGNIITAVS